MRTATERSVTCLSIFAAVGVFLAPGCKDKAADAYRTCETLEAKGDLSGAISACAEARAADPSSKAGIAAASKQEQLVDKQRAAMRASLSGKGSVAVAATSSTSGSNVASVGSYEDAVKGAASDTEAETLAAAECTSPIGGDLASSCNLAGRASIKLAVRNGKAAGVTVTSDPDQPAANACIKSLVVGLVWRSVPGTSMCTKRISGN